MLNLFQHNKLPQPVIPKQVRDDESKCWKLFAQPTGVSTALDTNGTLGKSTAP
jgi:hypothetical protein